MMEDVFLCVLSDSLFNPEKNITEIFFNDNTTSTKTKKIIIDSSFTPEFLKDFYFLLNPVQGLFYKTVQERYANSLFSAICVSPTSSGKTGIILLYIKHVLDFIGTNEKNPAVIYLCPLKALAKEKYKEFSEVFGKENVEIRTGDYILSSEISKKKILISTPDYLNLLIRNNSFFLENIFAFVIDEVHRLFKFEHDKSCLDEILWFIKKTNKKFLFLSATVLLLKIW